MYGAIIGDLAGSIYEYEQTKKITNVRVDRLIPDNAFFSDDTILTIAIMEAALNDGNYEKYLKEYGNNYLNYKPKFKPYFKTTFSPGFIKWLNGTENGTSIGNGAMMRISPIGYIFNDENEIVENVEKATIPSHDTREAIEAATLIALIIFYARKGLKKDEIIKKLGINLVYRPFDKFNTTCNETINNVLYALFTSNSFEDSIIKVISYGGDTDTNACIVGSMAESFYGIDESLISEVNKKIPEEFVKVLKKYYN